MTQKEKLYEQVLIASNEYKQLSGKSEMIVDIEAIKRDGSFSAYAQMRSLVELKETLEDMQAKVKVAKATKAAEEYFATPEGAARKQELEDNLAMEKDSLLFSRQKYREDMKGLILPYLGKDWKVDCSEASNIHIYLTDPVDGKEIFGHSFDLYLYDVIKKDDKLIYNIYASIGSRTFDVTHDNKYLSLFKTFGDIISNKQLMDDVLSIMLQAKGAKESIQEKIFEIKRQLQNPLA